MSAEELQEWLRTVLTGLVSKPDKIEIAHETDEMGLKFTVKIAQEDCGMVIGLKGATINAVRTILRVAGSKLDVRASLILDVPEKRY